MKALIINTTIKTHFCTLITKVTPNQLSLGEKRVSHIFIQDLGENGFPSRFHSSPSLRHRAELRVRSVECLQAAPECYGTLIQHKQGHKTKSQSLACSSQQIS